MADLLKRVRDGPLGLRPVRWQKEAAFMPDAKQASEILERLGIDATAPPLAPARAPPHQLEAFDPPGGDYVDPPCPDLP